MADKSLSVLLEMNLSCIKRGPGVTQLNFVTLERFHSIRDTSRLLILPCEIHRKFNILFVNRTENFYLYFTIFSFYFVYNFFFFFTAGTAVKGMVNLLPHVDVSITFTTLNPKCICFFCTLYRKVLIDTNKSILKFWHMKTDDVPRKMSFRLVAPYNAQFRENYWTDYQ